MKVYLANAYPDMPRSYIPLVRDLAARDRFGAHQLVAHPAQADLIWFVDARSDFRDWYLKRLRRHPLVRRYPERCMMYNEISDNWPALPGVFVSPPTRDYNPRRQRSCGYIVGVLNEQCERIGHAAYEPDLLFSFSGRPICPVRHRMMRIDHSRGLIEDTSGYNYFTGATDERLEQQKLAYAQTMARSKFVLCPRGVATSSIRAYEAMAAGRVPVILSDGWVPPRGPDWSRFALFIPEAEVDSIPARLEAIEDEAAERGRLAREAYEQWFGPEVRFHHMIESCRAILEQRRVPERVRRWSPHRRVLEKRYEDHKRTLKQRLKRFRSVMKPRKPAPASQP